VTKSFFSDLCRCFPTVGDVLQWARSSLKDDGVDHRQDAGERRPSVHMCDDSEYNSVYFVSPSITK